MQTEDITTGALPMIDLTPIKLIIPAVPALLRSALTKKQITVAFNECVLVEDHAVEGETAFDLSFTVTTQEGEAVAEEKRITKRVVISNETLAEEARLGNEGMLKVMESSRRAVAESRRMRELAGIPHKDNFV
jgi:hypothetical protein